MTIITYRSIDGGFIVSHLCSALPVISDPIVRSVQCVINASTDEIRTLLPSNNNKCSAMKPGMRLRIIGDNFYFPTDASMTNQGAGVEMKAILRQAPAHATSGRECELKIVRHQASAKQFEVFVPKSLGMLGAVELVIQIASQASQPCTGLVIAHDASNNQHSKTGKRSHEEDDRNKYLMELIRRGGRRGGRSRR